MGLENDQYHDIRELFRHHIESFDYFIDAGLDTAIKSIRPIEIRDSASGQKIRIWCGNSEVGMPLRDGKGLKLHDPIYPQECREAKSTYKGKLTIEICFQYNDGMVRRESLNFGYLPIMLMSKLCHLRGAGCKKLVSHKEEATDMGGYFICNGMERLSRLLILQKRNYPMVFYRKSYCSRGDGFTDKAISIRCVRDDQSSVNLRLYYLQNGSARIGFWVRMKEYLLPVDTVLKALIDTTDREIYVSLTSFYNKTNKNAKGSVGTQLVGERAKIILDEQHNSSLSTRLQCLQHIGDKFRAVMHGFENESDIVVGEAVLRDYILVHLKTNPDKFNLIIFMLQKLFSFVDQTSAQENPDALQYQEVLTVGNLLSVYIKDKTSAWLEKSRRLIQEELKKQNFKFDNIMHIKKIMDKNTTSIGRSMESMIQTGNLVSLSSVDLPQREGLTIPAERVNFHRFLSHFRAVHRGTAFAQMRTTTVRKLLPESWGFLCPVHTPDGTPCGLLNHMTAACRVSSFYDSEGNIKDFLKIKNIILSTLVEMGMVPLLPKIEQAGSPEVFNVLLDGCIVGTIASNVVEKIVGNLRQMKVHSVILDDLEIGYVPLSLAGSYPGLYLFTSPSRLVRPVRNNSNTSGGGPDIELIGPFEQAYMEIKCPDGGDGGRQDLFPSTHEELHPTGMLSVIANLTPWSDHNQSPRNMYQCQMAKQTLAFGSQALKFRCDNKLYHLQTPQSPIVRTSTYNRYCMDEFPSGTNAIVAVLSYTGYDMEDAMILNKSSVERGFCHAHIYQTETVDLASKGVKSDNNVEMFSRGNDKSRKSPLDSDGLPYIGQLINPQEALYSTYNLSTSQIRHKNLKSSEPAFVESVSVDGSSNTKFLNKANIRLRRVRNPIIGDKFSSRHGQKGVCSKLWPDIDMPFSSVTGMRPDLIINPHAFPSRMTIGMLLESIAAKGGSLQGTFIDATPFARCTKDATSNSESSEIDDLGPLLASHGFNYHGTEVMYSGVFGTELVFEIFIGPVYYQRLRHMVSDKFQVRSTGIMDKITRQPIGGRKHGGGVRFGEMERDALLAHGAAYMLHDRLHTCSDYHIADVCSLCGSLLTASTIQRQKRAAREISGLPPARPSKAYTCHSCETTKGMETVAMPYVFRYLAAELAAMNVKLTLNLNKCTTKG